MVLEVKELVDFSLLLEQTISKVSEKKNRYRYYCDEIVDHNTFIERWDIDMINHFIEMIDKDKLTREEKPYKYLKISRDVADNLVVYTDYSGDYAYVEGEFYNIETGEKDNILRGFFELSGSRYCMISVLSGHPKIITNYWQYDNSDGSGPNVKKNDKMRDNFIEAKEHYLRFGHNKYH